MNTIDTYEMIRQAKQQNLRSEDMLNIVNQEIMQFCDLMVIAPEHCHEDCLYRDINNGIYCVSSRTGEADVVSEDGEYIGDRFTMQTLNYLQPGKEAVPLITCFPENNSGQISGPVRYCYPDGSLAGLEYYSYRDNIDMESRIHRERSIWFSPDGKQICMHEFDAVFHRVLKSFQLEDYFYAPRKQEYRDLATQFGISLNKYNDESLLISFREQIASWPDEKLKILEEQMRGQHSSKRLEPDVLESCIKKYVYGIVDQQKLSSDMSQQFFEYISKHVINSSHSEILVSEADGQKIYKFGDFQYEQIGCYEISRKYKYVEVWQDGIKSSAGFMTSTSYGECQIGPSVTFYPNGDIYRIAYYQYAGNSLETDTASVQYYDVKGRLSTLEVAHKQYQEQWTDVRQKAQENNKGFDVGKIVTFYKKLCQQTDNSLTGSKKRKK